MKVQLKSTDGTENLYPVTAANSVIFPDGRDLEVKLPIVIQDSISDAMQNLVSYPTFQINDAMHLTMKSPDEEALSLFSLDSNGHLIMTV